MTVEQDVTSGVTRPDSLPRRIVRNGYPYVAGVATAVLVETDPTIGNATLSGNGWLLGAAVVASILGIKSAVKTSKEYNALLQDQVQDSPYANPNLALREATINNIKHERRRKFGAVVFSTIGISSLLAGQSEITITTEHSAIDSLGVVVVTDLDSREKDVTDATGTQITRVKAQVDGALGLGKELQGVPTTYVAASGDAKIIGTSDGSTPQDNIIVSGIEDFVSNTAASYPQATGDSINTAITFASEKNGADHVLVIGNFGYQNRPPQFANQEQPGVNDISVIGFGNDTTMQELVGEEDYYSVSSTSDVTEAVKNIVTNNQLTITKSYDIARWFSAAGLTSLVALGLGVFGSNILRNNTSGSQGSGPSIFNRLRSRFNKRSN